MHRPRPLAFVRAVRYTCGPHMLVCGQLHAIIAPFSLDLWKRLMLIVERGSHFHIPWHSQLQHRDRSPKRCVHVQSCYCIYSRLMVAGARPGTPDLASLLLHLLLRSQRSLCFPGKHSPPSFSGFASLQRADYFIARCLLLVSPHINTEKAEKG